MHDLWAFLWETTPNFGFDVCTHPPSNWAFKTIRRILYNNYYLNGTKFVLSSVLLQRQAVLPVRSGQPRNEVKCTELREKLRESLDIIENYFLKDRKFVAGDQVSIADMSFFGEVTQYWIADCDIYKGRPNMEKWAEECQKLLSQHFEEIFGVCLELRKSGKFHASIDVGQTA